ncbi:unnamed protein product, partial [marine sediment metagenome]
MVTPRITRELWKQHILGFPDLVADVGELQAEVDELRLEMEHDSIIFPDSTARTVEFTAGTPADTWGDWDEVEDDTPATPVTFSSKVTKVTHVTGILVED